MRWGPGVEVEIVDFDPTVPEYLRGQKGEIADIVGPEFYVRIPLLGKVFPIPFDWLKPVVGVQAGDKFIPKKPSNPGEWPGWPEEMDCLEGKILTVLKVCWNRGGIYIHAEETGFVFSPRWVTREAEKGKNPFWLLVDPPGDGPVGGWDYLRRIE